MSEAHSEIITCAMCKTAPSTGILSRQGSDTKVPICDSCAARFIEQAKRARWEDHISRLRGRWKVEVAEIAAHAENDRLDRAAARAEARAREKAAGASEAMLKAEGKRARKALRANVQQYNTMMGKPRKRWLESVRVHDEAHEPEIVLRTPVMVSGGNAA